jgi:hypothetical protein
MTAHGHLVDAPQIGVRSLGHDRAFAGVALAVNRVLESQFN